MLNRLFALPLLLAMTAIVHAADNTAIEFSTDQSAAHRIATSLISSATGQGFPDQKSIAVGLVDLNQDGTRDMLVFAKSAAFCKDAGCMPVIYTLNRARGSWARVPLESDVPIIGQPINWSVAPEIVNGWVVLIYSTDTVSIRLEYDGTAYKHVAS